MSVKEEVESKTKKLTKLFNKLQNAEQEIKDLQVVTQIWHKSGKFIELNIQTKPFALLGMCFFCTGLCPPQSGGIY